MYVYMNVGMHVRSDLLCFCMLTSVAASVW